MKRFIFSIAVILLCNKKITAQCVDCNLFPKKSAQVLFVKTSNDSSKKYNDSMEAVWNLLSNRPLRREGRQSARTPPPSISLYSFEMQIASLSFTIFCFFQEVRRLQVWPPADITSENTFRHLLLPGKGRSRCRIHGKILTM